MYAYAFESKVHSIALVHGASGLPSGNDSCTPRVCVPDVIGGLTVWRHNKKENFQCPTTRTSYDTYEHDGFRVQVPVIAGVPFDSC